jgi:DNA-binding NtrC family response regulator
MRKRGAGMCTESCDPTAPGDLRPRVLVVDDDAEMRSLLGEVLSEAGYHVEQAADGAEALIRLRGESFAAIVLDKNMPGLSGLDLLPGLRKMCPETAVILITAFGDVATYMEAMEKGAFEYVFKPFRMEELLRVLQRAFPTRRREASSSLAQGEEP